MGDAVSADASQITEHVIAIDVCSALLGSTVPAAAMSNSIASAYSRPPQLNSGALGQYTVGVAIGFDDGAIVGKTLGWAGGVGALRTVVGKTANRTTAVASRIALAVRAKRETRGLLLPPFKPSRCR